jgi:hypothetical protein
VVRGRARREGGRCAPGQPHLVIWVDPAVGLMTHHLDEACRWLLALKEIA